VTGQSNHDAFARLRTAFQTALLAAMREHVARMSWGAQRIEAHQREGLRTLLAHAVGRSAFHRRRLAGIDPQRFELADLPRLPIMTKREMMADLDGVFCDPRLTTALVERALGATTSEPVPILDRYVALASGGSSGQRGVFVLDRDALVEFVGSLTRPLMAQLPASGGPPPGGMRIAMVAAASAVHATGSTPALTAGDRMPFRFLSVPVTLPLPQMVERLNALQAPGLSGYPSMLARLAAERLAGRLRIAPQAVTSTSETLLPGLRAAIAEGFGVPVVDMFGSTEGLVGSSAPDEAVLTFNSDACIVEFVDEGNRPVAPGTRSAKALVTNIANRVQPLIRYEMTDSFVRQADAADSGHVRATVEGRSDDMLRYDGIDVHPLVIRAVMVKAAEVIDYQVRQTHRGVDVTAVAPPALDVDRLRAGLATALVVAGLPWPEVTVRAVAALERHPETGKVRRFVPLG
jgi:phenylacetate-coenzyme A ligase PaaK-like adenylate-forming protein